MTTLKQRLYIVSTLMAVVAIYLGLYLGYLKIERDAMLDALPAALEVDGVEWIDSQSGWREGFGGAVFRLTPAARQRLQEQGLQVLATAVQARGYTGDYYHYQPWQPTPADVGEGWSGLTSGEMPAELERRISRGRNNPGGYITGKPEGTLLVLPGEGLVVFAYNG